MQFYAGAIKDCFYMKRRLRNSSKAKLDDVFLFLYEDLIVNFDVNMGIARFLFRNTSLEKIQEINAGINKFKKRNYPLFNVL